MSGEGEVIARVERRRRWNEAEKAVLLAESEGTLVASVRRHVGGRCRQRLFPIPRPIVERRERGGKPVTERGQGPVARRVMGGDAGFFQFGEAGRERVRGQSLAAGLYLAKAARFPTQFPDDAQYPAAAEEVQRSHDGAAGSRAFYRSAGQGGTGAAVGGGHRVRVIG